MTETLQTLIRELTTGSTFAGRYQVIEELRHGGMGRVFVVLGKELIEGSSVRQALGFFLPWWWRTSSGLPLPRAGRDDPQAL